MFCVLLVILIATQNNRWRIRSFFFSVQEGERPTGGHRRIALDRLSRFKDAAVCLFSHLNLVLSGFVHHKIDLGWSTFGCVPLGVVGEVVPPSTSGTRLKVEKPATDPQRKCLDFRVHQVWWINSGKKAPEIFFKIGGFHLLLATLVGDEVKTPPPPMH